MKKDKEWLKDSFFKLDKNPSWGNSDYHLGYDDAFEIFEGLIDQLNEPEITEEQAWNKIAESYPADVRSLVTSFQNFYYGDFIKNPTLSKKETVEIPHFIDKWVRSFDSEGGSKWDLLGVVTNMTSANVSKADTDIFNWLNDGNRKLFMDAINNGYTIETPKTLQVIVKNYDSTVFTTELPEDEAMELIEGWKGNE